MSVLVRAVMGVVAGVLGVIATAIAMSLFTGSCRFEEPYETHSARCDGPAAYSLLLMPVVFVSGVAGTALLHVWLLKVLRLPRPWWVVAPGVCLVVVFAGSFWSWSPTGALVTLPAAFAAAGVITGFGPRSFGTVRIDGEDSSGSR